MKPEDITLDTIELRYDLDDGMVEVKPKTEWHRMSPADARELADGYEKLIHEERALNTADAEKFVALLREYADKAEAMQ